MKRVVILGNKGLLGGTLAQKWAGRFELNLVSRVELDVSSSSAIASFFEKVQADWVFNCTGLTSLEACEEKPELAAAINVEAPGTMAAAAARRKIRFVHFSTDYVFDGKTSVPYREEDAASPLGVYGKTKLEGERRTLAASPEHLIFRISWVFGPGRESFSDMVIRKSLAGEPLSIIGDKWASPTSAADLADCLEQWIESPRHEGGIFHFCNSGVCTWVDYARHALLVASEVGLPLRTTEVAPVPLEGFPFFHAPRPVFSALDCSKLEKHLDQPPRPWQDALTEYLQHQFSKRP